MSLVDLAQRASVSLGLANSLPEMWRVIGLHQLISMVWNDVECRPIEIRYQVDAGVGVQLARASGGAAV
jgi:hypothetical protein